MKKLLIILICAFAIGCAQKVMTKAEYDRYIEQGPDGPTQEEVFNAIDTTTEIASDTMWILKIIDVFY